MGKSRASLANPCPTQMLPLLLLLLLVLPNSCAASQSVYNTFVQCLAKGISQPELASKIVFSQTNSSYTLTLRNYIRNARFNTTSAPKPTIIVTPLDEFHVQAAVSCAKSINMQLKIRSGGHDYDGISYISDQPFIILDMFNLRAIDVNIKEGTVKVQAGATLGELYYRIWEKSKVHGFPAGVCPTVGVGGHFSGGGYGNMLRKYGLAVDNIIDAQFVDANGNLYNDRSSMGEDIFWAINGGGGASFGVVISYTIRIVPVPKTVTVFRIERLLAENATDLVYKWQSVAPSIDNNLFMRMLLQPVTRNKTKTLRASVVALFLGNAQQLVSVTSKGFPEMELRKENCMEMSWIESVLWWANFDNGTSPNVLLDRALDSSSFLKRKSDYVQKPISKDGLEKIWKKMIEIGKTGLVFNPYGGRMSQISPSITPFPHRAGNLFKIQYSVNWDEAGAAADNTYITQIRKLYSFMTPFVAKNPRSSFFNYRDLDIGVIKNGNYAEGKVFGEKYFKSNFDRLVKIKTAIDPENFFRNEQSIPPLPKKA